MRLAWPVTSRRRRERPATVSVTLLRGDEPVEVVLPIDKAPAVLQLPTFLPAGFLVGRRDAGITICARETIGFGPAVEPMVRAHDATGFRQTDTIDPTALARMLAKIGYAYTVGVFGLVPLDEVLVLPFIRGEEDDAGHWVGSADFETESERRGAMHALTHIVYEASGAAVPRVLVARIKLFAGAGARDTRSSSAQPRLVPSTPNTYEASSCPETNSP
jgi:hypothetical protein